MGEIRFKYYIHHLNVTVEQMIYELEYGNTFTLGKNSEKMTTLKFGELTWVDWRVDQNILELIVDDQFFSADNIFEKIITSFIYNLLDFGEIKLEMLDFSKSKWKKLFYQQEKQLTSHNDNTTFLGTVIKPYYHTSLKEKIEFINKMATHNISYVKEDETYLLDLTTLEKNTISIHSAIDSKIHYVPNITSALREYDLIETFLKHNITPVMVNILVVGFHNIRKLKNEFPELRIWGHRVGYNLFERHVSVLAFSQLCLLSGISSLHIGTPCSEVAAISKNQLCNELISVQPDFTPVFTKTSPEIARIIQNNIRHQKIIMACGYLRDNSGRIDYRKVAQWAEVSLNEE